MRRLTRVILHTLEWLAVILATFVAVRAFDAHTLPDMSRSPRPADGSSSSRNRPAAEP